MIPLRVYLMSALFVNAYMIFHEFLMLSVDILLCLLPMSVEMRSSSVRTMSRLICARVVPAIQPTFYDTRFCMLCYVSPCREMLC